MFFFLGASVFIFVLQIMNLLHSTLTQVYKNNLKFELLNDVYAALLMDHCASVLDKLSMLVYVCTHFGRKCMYMYMYMFCLSAICLLILKCSLVGTV